MIVSGKRGNLSEKRVKKREKEQLRTKRLVSLSLSFSFGLSVFCSFCLPVSGAAQ